MLKSVLIIGSACVLLIAALAVLFNGEDTQKPTLTTQPAKLGSARNRSNRTRQTAARAYTVSEIDERKNAIPTGTELTVLGTTFGETWTQNDDCTWLLAGRHYTPQHGEADPTDYCRFSVKISEKNADGTAEWPGAALICDTTPQEMHTVAQLYPYGTAVRVHGLYAASLDFNVIPFPNGHFGIPVLENCTVSAQ